MLGKALAVAVAIGSTVASIGAAQAPELGARVRHRVGIWGGVSTGNPRVFAGITEGLDLALVAVRTSWRLAAGRENALEWVVEAYPAAWLHGRPRLRLDSPLVPQPGNRLDAFGVGLAPVGLRGLVGFSSRTRLALEGGGGLMIFTTAVPDELGRRANFTYHAGAAIEHDLDGRRSLVLGYRLLHISNAASAPLNPGIENGVVYLGLLHAR